MPKLLRETFARLHKKAAKLPILRASRRGKRIALGVKGKITGTVELRKLSLFETDVWVNYPGWNKFIFGLSPTKEHLRAMKSKGALSDYAKPTEFAFARFGVNSKTKQLLVFEIQNELFSKSDRHTSPEIVAARKEFRKKFYHGYEQWHSALMFSVFEYAKKKGLTVYMTTPEHQTNLWNFGENKMSKETAERVYGSNVRKAAQTAGLKVRRVPKSRLGAAAIEKIQSDTVLRFSQIKR